MDDDRDSGAASVLLAFLLGGMTGAALALLYAPRSGQETRDLLAERVRDTADRSRQIRDDVVGKGRAAMDEAVSYVDRQKHEIESRKERLASAVEAGRQAYRDERSKEKA